MNTAEQTLVENDLLAQLKAGDQAAFEFFYNKYHLQLHHRILKLVHIDIIAEELLQDLFLKVWQKRELIDPTLSFKSYLYRIAENLIADHYRSAARQLKIERSADVNAIEVADSLEEAFPRDLALNAINDALETLPIQQKRVFTLAKMEGKSYEEIGNLLGISHATIHTHMSRTVKHIKEHIRLHHGSALGLALVVAIMEMAEKIT